jgi:hypothetical protein
VNAYGVRLNDNHAAMLEASGIDPVHARRRGYISLGIGDKKRLAEIGITKAGRNVPGLLIPLLDKHGSVWGWQYRPDSPRANAKGKPIKYETPWQQRSGIDVPPGVGPLLDDPTVPLWITEGTKKADSAALAGLACISISGVWSWLGRNDLGGITALADWHDIARNGRDVILAFDSDVMRKPQVRQALVAFARYLEMKGAK